MLILALENKEILNSLKTKSEYNGTDFSTTETELYFHLCCELCEEDEIPVLFDWSMDHFNMTDSLSIAPIYITISNIDTDLKNNISYKSFNFYE